MNQDAEQTARDEIDRQLIACGWLIQDKANISLYAGLGIAVRYIMTQDGKETDYVMFVNGKPVGIIEAKRAEEAERLTTVEEQSTGYATSKLKYLNNDPLPFVYESTGILTHFTDYRDPKPRAREVFTFHRPETFERWLMIGRSLRDRILDIPALSPDNLRDCQITAITNLEESFRDNRPKALIQMATGSGKTFTAVTSIYRLLKEAKAKKILFLVDTKNLGEQAESEFLSYQPADSNQTFGTVYGVTRLRSGYVPPDSQVYISTIQRLYSILKGVELDESSEEENPNENEWKPKAPMPVVYNPKVPIEFFDFIVIDECHRSIYNVWQQVLDYFDSFLIGLTATPDNRTFGFFNQNIISEYTHEQAVIDGVNVGYNIYTIDTHVSKNGGVIWQGEYVGQRERLTRRKRWSQLDEDKEYTAKQLDKDVVNPSQIRLIIRQFKEHLFEMFPDRAEAPKTLIFAKTDSHADDIIQIVREEFAEGNNFCKKITYNSEDPKSTLAQFRNEYNPRIAVTVDMIATGTDVKPLECLLFMRDVKSRNYFEQMKGRGTRTISLDKLIEVTPSARYTKDHFVIVDAIGVTRSLKTDSRPLERYPTVPLKNLLAAVAMGARDEDLFSSLANRLIRLDRQLTDREKLTFGEKAQGKTIAQVARELLNAYDPDIHEQLHEQVERDMAGCTSAEKQIKFEARICGLQDSAAKVFTGELNTYIEKVRQVHDQVIDSVNTDTLIHAGWDQANIDQAKAVVQDFAVWIETHRDQITALQIFYGQPYRRRELTYTMIQELFDTLHADHPAMPPMAVWRAYETLEQVGGSPLTELTAIVSLVRRVCGIDTGLTAYDRTVDRNFKEWIFKKQAGAVKYSEEQMAWLRMIKDCIATSFHVDKENFDLDPLNKHGGLGRFYQLFGDKYEEIINELNEALAA
jgi:type I restriction enzyme R subunit